MGLSRRPDNRSTGDNPDHHAWSAYPELGGASKAGPAVAAGERLLARVRPHVVLAECTALGKGAQPREGATLSSANDANRMGQMPHLWGFSPRWTLRTWACQPGMLRRRIGHSGFIRNLEIGWPPRVGAQGAGLDPAAVPPLTGASTGPRRVEYRGALACIWPAWIRIPSLCLKATPHSAHSKGFAAAWDSL